MVSALSRQKTEATRPQRTIATSFNFDPLSTAIEGSGHNVTSRNSYDEYMGESLVSTERRIYSASCFANLFRSWMDLIQGLPSTQHDGLLYCS